jgi:hypothetical protein
VFVHARAMLSVFELEKKWPVESSIVTEERLETFVDFALWE